MKGVLKNFKRFSFTLVVTGLIGLWFVMSGSRKQYSYSTDGLVRQNTALHKPVTQHSTSVNKTLPSSLETLDVMDKYFREMRKTMGMENKNKTEVFHEDAVPHPAIPKDLKGMNRTVQREPVKYRMLLRRQKNPQIDQKLEYLASQKKKVDVQDKKINSVIDSNDLNRAIQDARESIQHLLQHKALTSSDPVLLVTYMRSGSSWLGDITKQANNSFYVYEPFQFIIEQGYYTNGLVCFYNDNCRLPRKDSESHHIMLKNLLQIYACDFENLHPRVKHNVYRRKKYLCRQKIRTTKLRSRRKRDFNLETKNTTKRKDSFESECLKLQTDECRNSKYRIIKTIRISMDLVQSLMDFIPQLKVIHLVRDPRAITNSRTHSGNMILSKKTEPHSKSLCKQMHLDLKISHIMRSKYPTSITMVIYEALAENPLDAAKYIYKHLNIRFDRNIENWVYQSAHAEENNGFYGTQRANSTIASAHWRNETKIEKVKLVQNHCEDVMDLLGYVLFNSQEELRNLDIPARQRIAIPGYS